MITIARRLFGKSKVSHFSDASIWVDFSDPNSYTLSGDVFTSLQNKGTLGGSFTINGSPTLTADNAILHDSTNEWVTLTKTFSRLFTVFAVWQALGANTLNHYLFGTPNANRDEFRWGTSGANQCTYFGLSMANVGNQYNATVKNAFCLQQVSGDHNVYARTTLQTKSGVGVPTGPAITSINILSGRSGFTDSNGIVKLWEFALYESSLPQSVIFNKQLKTVLKHKL